jgi:HAD superfamily hydrolase (TIGR01509 family)
MIAAVVFDFDGLILDTEMPGFLAWAETFASFGASLTEDEHAMKIGAHFDRLDLLRSRVPDGLPHDDEVRALKRARHDELLASEVVQPGVEAWLAEATALGLPLALASSSDSEWIEGHLDRLGLRHHFRHVVCCENGMPPKPAPDCYLAACAALEVDPARALAGEDSANGGAAAKAAGLWCLAVPNALTKRLDLSAADLRLESLADATLGEVAALLSR